MEDEQLTLEEFDRAADAFIKSETAETVEHLRRHGFTPREIAYAAEIFPQRLAQQINLRRELLKARIAGQIH